MVSDRDCLIAITNAILALAERITGERMTIYLRTEDGRDVQITGANASWSAIPDNKTIQEAA